MMQSSGLLVVIASWTAIGVFALSLLLFGVIVAIRWGHDRRKAARERLRVRWREILAMAVVERPDSAPSVGREEAQDVLAQWGYYQEFLTGDCQDNLTQLARLSGLDVHAKRFLEEGNTRLRLMGIQALGCLRNPKYLSLLWPIARSDSPYEALAAAHAVLRIAPRESIRPFVRLISRRPDWSPAKVMAMLQEAGPEIVSEPLARAAVEAEEANMPLLVVYLEAAHDDVALDAILQILPNASDPQVIATCLYVLRHIVHPRSLELLRQYLSSPNWILQLHSVIGIGRLGNEQDVPDLIRMLRHKRFWVRYRAAQALANLPTVGPRRLEEIGASQKDRYARDILRQVLTERAA